MSSSPTKKKNLLLLLFRDKRTVFHLIDIAMLTGETDRISLGKKLNYHVKKGQLQNPRKGIYVKPEFDPEELACRIYSPSYISLEYVLARNGIVFQYDERITSVSYLSRQVRVADLTLRYRKIKGELLVINAGLEKPTPFVTRALPERAFLDLLYLDPAAWIDNPAPLDKKKVLSLLSLYNSAALTRRVKKWL